jgi:hypothetical protein
MALGLVLHSTASLTTEHQKLEAEHSFMLHCLPSTSIFHIARHWPHCAQGRFQLLFTIRPDVSDAHQLYRIRHNTKTNGLTEFWE